MIDVAYAQAAGGGPAGGGPLVLFYQILPILLVFLIFYLLILRPQANKQKELQKTIAALKPGDRVVTSGGILAEVAGIKDQTVTLRIADGVKVEFTRQSIVGVQKREG